MGEEAGPLRQIVASGDGMMDGVGDPKDPKDSGARNPKDPAKILCHLSLSLLSYTVCDS